VNIGVLTLHDPKYRELAGFTNLNKWKYCAKNGYTPLFRECENIRNYWMQYKLVQQELADFDWIWKSDTDLAITNMDIKLESILDRSEDFLIGTDFNGINCGSLFFRNTEWTCDFLCRWLSAEERFAGWTNPDQTALAHMIPLEDRSKWAVLPQRACNSYLYQNYPERGDHSGQYQDGDFCLHLPALSIPKRLQIFRSLKLS
jgi:hypothetical protein